MVARSYAARDLHIDEIVANMGAVQYFQQDALHGRPVQRPGNAQLRHRTLQPVEMWPKAEKISALNGAYLIDAIRELIAAVLDMNRCETMGDVASVDIGDARHDVLSVRNSPG